MRAGVRSSLAVVALAGAACHPGEAEGELPGRAWFADEAEERGLDFAQRTGQAERYLFPEIVCGGAALFDVDGDGDLDAYLVQADGVLRAREQREPNRMYANRGDGHFGEVTEASGTADRGYGMGAAVGDADGDGDLELYVTNLGDNVLYENVGGGKFHDVTASSGTAVGLWSSSAGFLDHDLDGDLDLYVANYLHWSEAFERTCYAPPHGETYCGPKAYDRPIADTLFRNEGGLLFRDVSVEAGLHAAKGNGLGVVALDQDLDGWPDVFVANDASPNQLWQNQRDGTFLDRAVQLGCATDQDGMVKAGMGVGVGDLDEDGDEDLLVVNMQQEPDTLFRNDRASFVDRTAASGIRTVTQPFTRFGCAFVDFDQDGLLDLYEANGNILHSYKDYGADPFAEPNVLFRGLGGGRFAEVQPRGGTLPVAAHTSRAAAFGDVDGDGDVDVLVVNRDGPTYLLVNRAEPAGHWLGFRVVEGRSDAIGAVVEVRLGARTLMRTVRSAYSYCAANDLRAHFGLGSAAAVDEVRVRWPRGELETFGAPAVDRYWVLRRGTGTPE
jgi:hypothetical protein